MTIPKYLRAAGLVMPAWSFGWDDWYVSRHTLYVEIDGVLMWRVMGALSIESRHRTPSDRIFLTHQTEPSKVSEYVFCDIRERINIQ